MIGRRFAACSLVVLLGGCAATIPKTRYGVDSIEIEGTDAMSEQAILNCLSTEERDHFTLPLGIGEAGACGRPSFEADPPQWKVFRWWWTEWPLYDRIALEQDLQRIERWYAARGFHGAEVTDVRVQPEQAAEHDVLPEDDEDAGCERDDDDEGCRVDITIVVEEGEPTLVTEISIEGIDGIDEEIREEIEGAVQLEVGARWDEHTYDETKNAIRRVLMDHAFALATVEGVARIDRPRREARVELTVSPGPACVFGETEVIGYADLPSAPIRAAAGLQPGHPYSVSDLEDAQRAVYGLGAFSAVAVEGIPPAEGNVVPIRVEVTPADRDRLGLGLGIQSGIINKSYFSSERISVPQWDVHLIARYTHKNFLGGLRQLTLEERPRLIVQDNFPGVVPPRFGNLVSMELRQPGFPEARTSTRLTAAYDFGPDPYDTFFRHRIDTGIDVSRSFLHLQTLFALIGIRNSIYIVPDGELRENGDEPPSSSILTFLEQQVRLDLRDDRVRPHAGALFQVNVQEAGYFLPSSWDYVRLIPEARAYIPLPRDITLAARFEIGMYFITGADDDLDALSRELGPRDFRLRGGGAVSNRGYLPGRLGDGPEGGTRRWLASLELRVPLTSLLGLVIFGDAGDVSRETQFRFNYPQLSVGGGLRVYTPVGSLRLDIAGRIPGAQFFDEEDQRIQQDSSTEVSFGFFQFPGAVHLTIGESF